MAKPPLIATSKSCQCGGSSFTIDFAIWYALLGAFLLSDTMRSEIQLHVLLCSLKFLTILQLNHLYSLLATTETISLASANTTNDARLDIKTRGFWSRGQDAYFDVRVFYPYASSYCSLSLKSAINVMRIPRSVHMVTELGILNMVVFSPHWFFLQLGAWDMRPLFSTDVIAGLLATHWGQDTVRLLVGQDAICPSPYILQCAIMCIRGSRSSIHIILCLHH